MHDHGSHHLYDNGCCMCDAVRELHEIIEHGCDVPWADEDYEVQEMRRLIHYIRTDGAAYCDCGNRMGQDCNGDPHCDVCDPPCLCCCDSDGYPGRDEDDEDDEDDETLY